MIANFLSLNEINKKYQVSFNSRVENSFREHIRYKIVKFPDNYDGLYLSKIDKKFFRKVAEENKINMIEGLNRGLKQDGL